MRREWQPGDVALIKRPGLHDHTAHVAIFSDLDGWCCQSLGHECDGDPIRPLAVIDPEDAEQVERFVRTWASKFMWLERVAPSDVECAQAALREFAAPKPPKPDEPTGLGAVVRDADGALWVRRSRHDDIDDWCTVIHRAFTSKPWERIDAVEVLSEGVIA